MLDLNTVIVSMATAWVRKSWLYSNTYECTKLCKAILCVGHLQVPDRINSWNWHALSFYVKCGRKTLSFERQTKNTWNKKVEITTFSFLHQPCRLRKDIQAAQEFILKTCEMATWKKILWWLTSFCRLVAYRVFWWLRWRSRMCQLWCYVHPTVAKRWHWPLSL